MSTGQGAKWDGPIVSENRPNIQQENRKAAEHLQKSQASRGEKQKPRKGFPQNIELMNEAGNTGRQSST